jgi:hypothetical protein
MTTTFTHMAHVHPVEALATQPFGVALFLVTLSAFVVGLASLVGRSWWRPVWMRVLKFELQIAIGTILGMAAGWIYKCVSMGVLDGSDPLG